MSWQQTVPWIALFAAFLALFIQRQTINNLRAAPISCRSKRSIDDQSMFIPVYAQVSRKAMKRMCRQHAEKAKSMMPTTPVPSNHQRKHCEATTRFSSARLVAKRPNEMGSIIRDGPAWYTTEFHLGFNILHFGSIKALNGSEPRSVYTLPSPFVGTDHTVYNGTFFYANDDRLVSYHLKQRFISTTSLGISQSPLYNGSSSSMDIQAEEHGIWVIFRQKGKQHLSAARLLPDSLKVMAIYDLNLLETSSWCNAFIRCGVLHALSCEKDGIRLTPVYDFYQNMRIGGKTVFFTGIERASSTQYDPRSRSLTIFASGYVYSISTS